MKWLCVVWLSAVVAFAQGTTPKPTANDYEVHGEHKNLDIGAEYMVHSYEANGQMYLAERCLVVEVAFYPLMKDGEIDIDAKAFRLRLNDKTVLSPLTPAQAIASLKAGFGNMLKRMPMGGGPGGMGRGGPVDPNAGQGIPAPGSAQQSERLSPEEALQQSALPDGVHKGAVAGFVYFPFTGKPGSLKSVVLEYGDATLTLK